MNNLIIDWLVDVLFVGYDWTVVWLSGIYGLEGENLSSVDVQFSGKGHKDQSSHTVIVQDDGFFTFSSDWMLENPGTYQISMSKQIDVLFFIHGNKKCYISHSPLSLSRDLSLQPPLPALLLPLSLRLASLSRGVGGQPGPGARGYPLLPALPSPGHTIPGSGEGLPGWYPHPPGICRSWNQAAVPLEILQWCWKGRGRGGEEEGCKDRLPSWFWLSEQHCGERFTPHLTWAFLGVKTFRSLLWYHDNWTILYFQNQLFKTEGIHTVKVNASNIYGWTEKTIHIVSSLPLCYFQWSTNL